MQVDADAPVDTVTHVPTDRRLVDAELGGGEKTGQAVARRAKVAVLPGLSPSGSSSRASSRR